MNLVDEEDDILCLNDIIHHIFKTFLELAAVLRSGDKRCHR